MKGYFSRLIRQTGITTAGAPGQSSVRQNAAITPTHAEEERITDHPAEMMERKNSEDSTESPETSYRNKLSEGPQKRKHEERNVTVYTRNAQSPAERARSQPEINGLPGSEVEIDFIDKTRESNKSKGQELRGVNKSTAESTDTIVQERQAYLKEVREWVAGTPLGEDEEIKSGTAIEMLEAEKMVHSEGDIFKLSHPEPQQRSEFNDFHLSIGTISLIIEEPQKKEPPQTVKVENKSVQENRTSRLSRHYIRTG